MLLLTACGPVGDGDDSGTSGSGGAVRDGGTMTVALADDPDVLDPTLARTLVGRMVFMSMCEKLYAIDQKVNVVPQGGPAVVRLSKGQVNDLASWWRWGDSNSGPLPERRPGRSSEVA